ncbi:MAG: peptidoglycan-associated lipoprotein [Flavobacteriales bacterium]|nr:MAG: peptidoglycan-associated lipoprotein [Flavobacteriales bacterium]
MKKYIYLLSFIFIAGLAQAQDIPFDKKIFKERKDEFKEAKKNLDAGNDIFEIFPNTYLDINDFQYVQRKVAYREALSPFFKANKFNPNNAELNYKIGRCYLMSSVYKEECIPHFLKALKLNPSVAPDVQYHLGIGYHLTMDFDKAITAFNKYKTTLVSKNPAELEDVNKKIAECKMGKKLVAKPERVFIDNFGKPVNGKYPEYGAIISADESIMMFTSRRNTSTGSNKLPEGSTDYFEDIYITKKVDGKWTSPENMGSQINTDGHDATTAVSPDAQSMLIYKDTKGDGNLYECKLEGAVWSKPKKMNKYINTKHHESSASYSNDGKTLYFVSNKPGGFGNHDMYVTKWDEIKQDWGESKNLGPTLNTKYNEEAVLIHPDGKTLYFSSQGHSSMGNYDIFKSTLSDDGSWSTPENMGYPINTVDDDVFFVINASGRRGYYSSFKDDGHGEKDIYMITFLGPEKPFQLNSEDNLLASVAKPVSEKVVEKQVDALTKRITILKGVTSDCKTLKPVGATLELIDIDENKTLATFESNNTTGKYLVSLPSGKNYGLIIRKESYLFHSENFNIPETAAYQEVEKNICLKKIEVGSVIVLKNIFYDYNKATLRDASKNELDRLTKLLTENPTIKIELSAHTDSRGGNAYNEKLSQRRAQSCVDYLIKKGIATGRLVSKGYGETKLIKSDAEIAKLKFEDEKEAAHQENRRTEFKIIAK